MVNCRACSKPIKQFFSLGEMPLANAFLTKKQIPYEKRYDLSVGFCPNCYLVQLMKTVNPSILFNDYVYFSSVTQSIVKHSERTSDYLIKRFKLKSGNLVLEIGSNDGVHLQFYKRRNIDILGVDPAENIAKVANKKGIPTRAEFFNTKFARKLVNQENIQADIVYGANVFAHVPKIIDFLTGVKEILKTGGTAIFEFPYLKGLLENKFDTIYHEHVFYYSVLALRNLFAFANLELYDVEQIPMQGGSLRVFASHPKSFPIKKSVQQFIKEERKKGFDSLATYKRMNVQVSQLKKDIVALLKSVKKQNKRIVAYSAPAKGNILLNYFNIGMYLDYIVDKSPAKQGLYTPGTHLLVFAPERIEVKKPDYIIILCWNIADEVIKQLKKYQKDKVKFIIPIPSIKII